MDAYHGTYFSCAASIKAKGLVGSKVYITLDLELAEQYAAIRAKQHNDKPCIVVLLLPDDWPISPDSNSDDEKDAWVTVAIPAKYITDAEEIGSW